MCGIVGFNFKDNVLIQDMLKTIEHRGPDANGIFEDDFISIGHARLSILDLSSSANQPMYFENLVIAFNGEVYNYFEIKQELLLLGYDFFSNSDTEVILKAYHKWGIDAIKKFIGMFVIVIYDKNKQEIIIIRDRIGIKPLYYYFDNDKFIFASELKSIISSNVTLTISEEGLYNFLQYGYIAKDLSIFENTKKLPAGNYLIFSIKEKKIEINEYWSILDFFKMPKIKKSEKEIIDELEELIISSCNYIMVSDVPIGIFLSGGIDSSLISAILQKHHGRISTFTLGFNEQEYDESQFSNKIAKYLNTNHFEKKLSAKDALELFDQYNSIYDEPFGDSSGIPTTFISKFAKENDVKVVISADGGDELFGGYSRYFISYKLGKILFKIPYFIRNLFAKLLTFIGFNNLSKIIKIHNFEHKYNQFTLMLKEKTWESLYKRIISNFTETELEVLLGKKNNGNKDFYFQEGQKEHPIQGMMLWDYNRYLVDDILTKIDRATMYESIEARVPLLDHRIVEYMARVPFELKYKNGDSKYLLKKILKRYLPNELINKQKKGFAIPLYKWFSNDLNFLLEKHLNENDIRRNGIFNSKSIKEMKLELESKKRININKLWFILIFQLWFNKYNKK